MDEYKQTLLKVLLLSHRRNKRRETNSDSNSSARTHSVQRIPSQEPLNNNNPVKMISHWWKMAPLLTEWTPLWRLSSPGCVPPWGGCSVGTESCRTSPPVNTAVVFGGLVSIKRKSERTQAYQRAHAEALCSSSSWTCTAGRRGGSPEKRCSAVRAWRLLPRWSGWSMTHSTAHPSTGAPRHLNAARLRRCSPGTEYLQAQECSGFFFLTLKNTVKGPEVDLGGGQPAVDFSLPL